MQDGARNNGYLGLQVSDVAATNFANSQNYLRVGVYYYNTVSNRYRYWNGAIWHNGMSPVSLDDAYNDGNQINIGVNPVQLSSVAPNNAVLATDEGGGNNAVLFSNGNMVLGGAAMGGSERLRVVGDGYISGNLIVKGTFFTTEAEVVKINDNHLYLNNGYTLNVAQTGGLVVNFLPTAVTDTVAGAFTAGVAAVSNPTVITTGVGTYAVGDLIQISGANKDENNGLFEVLSHVGNVLTIRGVGITATVEDFTQNQFVNDAVVQGDIVQVTVSVIRAGLAGGLWEEGQGSTTPIVFNTIAVAPGGFATLDSAYDGGGAGLGRQIFVDSGAVELIPSATQSPVLYINQNTNIVTALRQSLFIDTRMNSIGGYFGVRQTIQEMAACGGAQYGYTYETAGNVGTTGATYGYFADIGSSRNAAITEVAFKAQFSGNYNNPGIDVRGIELVMGGGLALDVNSFYGVYAQLDNPYVAGLDIVAGKFEGDGRTVQICDNERNIFAINPLVDDTHAVVVSRTSTVEVLGLITGSALYVEYTIGAMGIGVLAPAIDENVVDNPGALGGTLAGMRMTVTGQSGSLAQKQGIRMLIAGTIDSGLDDHGYFLTASQTIDNGGNFFGFYGDLQSLGLTSYSYVAGLALIMPDDGVPVNTPIRGIVVTMPVFYSGSNMAGAEITGSGNALYLCNNTWTIEAQIGNVAIDQGQLAVNATSFFVDERIRVNMNATSQEGIYMESTTNPLTAGSTSFIHVVVGLNDPVAALKVIRVYNDELPSAANVINQMTIDDYHVIQAGNVAPYYSHNVELSGTRDSGSADFGWYLNAHHQIDQNRATYDGAYYNLANIDAQAYNYIHGMWIGMPDDVNATGQPIRGIVVAMPNAYTGGDMAGIQVDGDARQVWICNDDYAIQTLGDVYIDGKLTVTGLVDPTGVYLDEQGADLPNIANKGVLYTKDVATVTELFYRDSSGAVTQLTGSGGIPHSLQQSYNDGTTIAETLALGAVVINNAVNNASNALEINRTVGTGNGLYINSGANANAAIFAEIDGTFGIYFDNQTSKPVVTTKDYVMLLGKLNDIGVNQVRGVYFDMWENTNVSAQVVGFLAQVEHYTTSSMQNWAFYHRIQGNARNASEIKTVTSDINAVLNGASVIYRGLEVDNTDATLTNFLSFYGVYLNLNVNTAVNNPYYGLYVTMPSAYTGTAIKGARITGNGRAVEICNNTEAVRLTLPATQDGIVIDNATAITASKNLIADTVTVGNAAGATIIGIKHTVTVSADSNAIFEGAEVLYTPRASSTNTFMGKRVLLTAGSSITAAQFVYGFVFQPQTLTINNVSATIRALYADLSGTTLTAFNACRGVDIVMHTAMVANEVGIKVTGGNNVIDVGTNLNGVAVTSTSVTTARQAVYTSCDIGNLGALSADGLINIFTFSADSAGASVYGNRTRFTPRGNQAGHSINHYGFRSEIIPSGAVTGASQFYGLQYSNGALTLNNASIIDVGFDIVMSGVVATNYLQIYGARIAMPDDPTPVNRAIHGINITMPGAYTGSAIIGIRVTGDGRTMDICDTNYALYCQGEARFTNYLDMTGGSGFWFRPPSMTDAQETAMTGAWGAGDKGKMWFNTTSNQWKGWTGAAIVVIG